MRMFIFFRLGMSSLMLLYMTSNTSSEWILMYRTVDKEFVRCAYGFYNLLNVLII